MSQRVHTAKHGFVTVSSVSRAKHWLHSRQCVHSQTLSSQSPECPQAHRNFSQSPAYASSCGPHNQPRKQARELVDHTTSHVNKLLWTTQPAALVDTACSCPKFIKELWTQEIHTQALVDEHKLLNVCPSLSKSCWAVRKICNCICPSLSKGYEGERLLWNFVFKALARTHAVVGTNVHTNKLCTKQALELCLALFEHKLWNCVPSSSKGCEAERNISETAVPLHEKLLISVKSYTGSTWHWSGIWSLVLVEFQSNSEETLFLTKEKRSAVLIMQCKSGFSQKLGQTFWLHSRN